MRNEVWTEQIVPKFMTISELAIYSGIPSKCIRNMVKNGEVDYFRPGNKTFYVNVDSFMDLCAGRNLK